MLSKNMTRMLMVQSQALFHGPPTESMLHALNKNKISACWAKFNSSSCKMKRTLHYAAGNAIPPAGVDTTGRTARRSTTINSSSSAISVPSWGVPVKGLRGTGFLSAQITSMSCWKAVSELTSLAHGFVAIRLRSPLDRLISTFI